MQPTAYRVAFRKTWRLEQDSGWSTILSGRYFRLVILGRSAAEAKNLGPIGPSSIKRIPNSEQSMNTDSAENMHTLAGKVEYYRLRAHRKARSHYLAASHDQQMNTLLGVPVVITTAVVGTTIFATVSQQPNPTLQIAAGLLSLLAASLAALQTFFKYAERSEKHRTAGASYATIFRRLDMFKLRLAQTERQEASHILAELEAILAQIDQLEKDSPSVPDRFYDRAVQEQTEDKEGV